MTVAGIRAGSYRWVVCGLIFLATTVNYIDRQVIGILKPTLQHELGWSEIDYGNIVFAFTLAYAIGLLVTGRLVDRLGTKLGYALALTIWSAAAMAHAGSAYLVALAIVHMLVPSLQPARIRPSRPSSSS
jgi:ACS family hexuronate transporter-like MFS transporter